MTIVQDETFKVKIIEWQEVMGCVAQIEWNNMHLIRLDVAVFLLDKLL